MPNIGKNIKEARLKKNMKVEELAAISNISVASVYNYESDYVGKMSVEILILLANALEVPVTQLLGIEKASSSITGDHNILNGMTGSIGGNVTFGDGGRSETAEALQEQVSNAFLQEKLLELLGDVSTSVKDIKEILKEKL